MTLFRQQLIDQQSAHVVVLGDQDRKRRDGGFVEHPRVIARGEWLVRQQEWDREVKGAPDAFFALRPDPPAGHIQEPCHNGQTQTRAAVLARHITFRLAERLEDQPLLLDGYADPGVADGKL